MSMVLKFKEQIESKGIDTQKFCDEISKTFRDLSKTLNLTNTDFIRTTEIRHKKSVQSLWNELKKEMIFISQNILVGIQFLTKLFMERMKLKKLMG